MEKQLRGFRGYKSDFKRIARKSARASKREGRRVDAAEILHEALALHDTFESQQRARKLAEKGE